MAHTRCQKKYTIYHHIAMQEGPGNFENVSYLNSKEKVNNWEFENELIVLLVSSKKMTLLSNMKSKTLVRNHVESSESSN